MTSDNIQSLSAYNDQIDLANLFRILWSGKWVIIAITTAASTIAILVSLMLPNIYRAEALLAPHQESNASKLASQYGGLATIAGISLPSDSLDKTALGLAVLQSRKFISEFVKRREILVPLIAANGWDAKSGKLSIDADVFDKTTGQWVRDANPPRAVIPSLLEAHEAFSEILLVSRNSESGLVTLSIEHYSPTIAKQWVDWLVADLNSAIMQEDVSEAREAIDYLNKRIDETSLAELRAVLFRLIEEQTKTIMLANVSAEYMFKTVDPAAIPELKAKPRRVMIVLVSAVLSGLLSVLIVLMRDVGSNAHLPASAPDGLLT
jgi:uncharacterized protein involved in exopolysaccharide biosynthesis